VDGDLLEDIGVPLDPQPCLKRAMKNAVFDKNEL
jgi:hypothetical protein